MPQELDLQVGASDCGATIPWLGTLEINLTPTRVPVPSR